MLTTMRVSLGTALGPGKSVSSGALAASLRPMVLGDGLAVGVGAGVEATRWLYAGATAGQDQAHRKHDDDC